MKNIPEDAAVYLLITHATQERLDVVQEVAYLVRSSPQVAGVLCSDQPGVWFEGE